MNGWQEMAVGVVQWVALALALYCGLRFLANKLSPSFENAAQRMRKLGPAEFEESKQGDSYSVAVATKPVETPSPAALADESNEKTPSVLMPPQRPFYAANEKQIQEWLEKNVPESQRQEQLIRMLSVWQIQAGFENINYYIRGSQLSALGRANTGPMSEDALRSFYDYGVAIAPQMYVGDTFERWLHWLADGNNLITKIGSEFVVTDKGRELLMYLPSVGYPATRNG